jgi:4-carboxymuconolactone decarboxylase
MARLPYVETDSASSSVREGLARNPVSFLRMLAHADSAFDPWVQYTGTLLMQLELDPLLRELAILQVAHLLDSEYPWVQHVAIARAVGVSSAQIVAIELGSDEDPSFDDAQREVLRFARAVTVEGTASEQAVAELAGRLGARQVVELLLVIGHWMSIARLVAATGLEPDLPNMAGAMPEGLGG